MNKQIYSFMLLVSVFNLASAMEENAKLCPFQEYKLNGPSSIVCPLYDHDEIGVLMTEKSADDLNEHVSVMLKQITKPETSQLFADVLKVYMQSRYPYRPWCGSRSTKRNIELVIESLKQEKIENNDTGENLEFYNAEHQLLEMISEQKKTTRKLMAAGVALSLLELDELDQKESAIKQKLEEEKLKASEKATN